MNEAPKVTGNSTLPQGNNPVGGVNPNGGANPKAQAISQGVNALDKISDKLDGSDKNPTPQLGEQVATEPQVDENGNEVPGYKPGDKVAPGYEVGEDGKVKQSATSRLQGVIAGGATAYFSGGNTEAMDAARKVSDSKIGRKVSDTIEKTPIKNVAEEAEKNGVLDVGEGAMDIVTAAKNMDAKGIAEGAGKVKEGSKKGRKRMFLFGGIAIFVLIGFPLIIVLLIVTSVSSGVADENDTSSGQVYENTLYYDWEGEDNEGEDNENENPDDGDNGNDEITGDAVLLNIPYYNQGNYSSKKFGGKNIATSGCSVTSLAMILSYLKGQTITPPNVVDKIAEVKGNYNYYYVGDSGQSWDIMTDVPSFYGVSVSQIALSSVKSALAEGKPVIASVGCCTFTRHGHFIVIKGYDPVKGLYYVNDPNHSSFLSKGFPESTFANEAKAFWAFG